MPPSKTRSADIYRTIHRLLKSIQRGDETLADVVHLLLDPDTDVLEERLRETAELVDAYQDGPAPTRMAALDDEQAELPDEE